MDKYIGILIGLANTAFCGLGAYYARAAYYSSLPKKSAGQVGISTMTVRKPIIVIGVIGILLLISTWVVIYITIAPHNKSISEVQFTKWPDPYQPITVVGKTFLNEKVPLDGYSYTHCTFNNVTFTYNGTTTIQVSDSTIKGFTIKSDNPAVEGAILLTAALYGLRANVEFKLPPGSVFKP
jgi:archaellum component FlaF (FlaF/FlaG flagellin family)